MTETPPEEWQPIPCRVCGSRVALEHVIEPASAPRGSTPWDLSPIERPERRYAQVVCRMCHTTGPRVLFEPGAEWPHIEAERHAIAMWDMLHRRRQ